MAFNLEKLKDNDAIFWTFQWPKIREVAAACGWAVAIHGSVVHDLDLMAMPWVEEHTTADDLAECIASWLQTRIFTENLSKMKKANPITGWYILSLLQPHTLTSML